MGFYIHDFSNFSIDVLKRLCKFKKLANYSKLKKKELFDMLNEHISVIKIQRFFRSSLMGKDATCLISMEPIRYPCYPFKPKGSSFYVYYNLEVFTLVPVPISVAWLDTAVTTFLANTSLFN